MTEHIRFRYAVGLLPVFLFCLFSGCTRTTSAPPVEEKTPEPWETAELFLSFASSQIPSQRTGTLNARLQERSQGRIYCNVYPSGTMGGDSELIRAVRSGTLSLMQSATSVQAEQIPELSLLDIPFLFSDPEACNAQLSGPLMDFFQPCYNRAGLQLVAWYCPGFRQLTSSIPVEGSSDLADLRIRVLRNRFHRIYWEALGAQVFDIPYSQLFYSIQQGVVNAQENPVNAVLGMQINEIQSYLTLTDHLPFINAVVMNKDLYDALSAEDRETVCDVFSESCASMLSSPPEAELEASFEHVELPGESLHQALLAGVPTVEQALREELGDVTVDSFYATLQNGACSPEPP